MSGAWIVEELAGLPLVGLTAPGLLLLAILLVLTGRLVPRRTHDDVIRDRDDWKAAHQTSEKERHVQTRQIDKLLEYGRTVDSIMRALPHPLELPPPPTAEPGPDGEDDGGDHGAEGAGP